MRDTRNGAVGLATLVGTALLSCVLMATDPVAEQFWPQWRGPYASGVSRRANPPLEWSETKNIRWKIEIPGRGSASPVVWGDRLFVVSAVPVGIPGAAAHEPRAGIEPRDVHRFVVMAIDRRSGRVAWERTAREERPRQPSMKDGTWASSSAITDGRRVFAFFDSSGLYAYDMQGTLLWQKHFGDKKMFAEVGESGSTPVLYGDRLVLVWDHQGASFIVALDARTGEELWRARRQEVDSWATPLVVEHDGRAQVITAAEKRLRSYDLETGKIVWESEGLTMNPIPSPVAEDGMVFVTSGFRGSRLKAIRLAGARGDITGSTAIVWTLDRDTPYVSVAALVRRRAVFPQKQRGHPVGVRRKDRPAALSAPAPRRDPGGLLLTGRRARPCLHHQPRRHDGRDPPRRHFEVLATNTLDDGFDASAALVDDHIYLRGYRYLYRHRRAMSRRGHDE